MRLRRSIRVLLVALVLAATVPPVVMLRRVPTPTADSQLYASIARARQIYGIGVPTITWNSPVAVDHIPFYGPVFFDLASWALDTFGFRLFSFRLASLIGCVLVVASGALLAYAISGEADRALWAIALLALAPEVSQTFTIGVMHLLAVGFEMLALAVFARGLVSGRDSRLYGAAAGLLLALAALTTPRSYLFIAAFVGCGAIMLPAVTPVRRASAAFAAAMLVLLAVVGVWTVVSHENPARWARYMTFILTHEDSDVAILPTAVREWSFGWSLALTPTVAAVGAFVAGRVLDRADAASRDRAAIAAFVLLVTWVTFVATFVCMNLTFNTGEYSALPLLAAIVATPQLPRVRPRIVAVGVSALLATDAGVLVLHYARVAATWDARDPTALVDFVAAHVPRGSVVVGPEAPYFFTVERAGSVYRTVSARSWADWARWVPAIEPESVRPNRHIAVPVPRERFFIWPGDNDLPPAYRCVAGHVVATFEPPPNALNRLGPFGGVADDGYPPTVLYRLPRGCPEGYDPTLPPDRSPA